MGGAGRRGWFGFAVVAELLISDAEDRRLIEEARREGRARYLTAMSAHGTKRTKSHTGWNVRF